MSIAIHRHWKPGAFGSLLLPLSTSTKWLLVIIGLRFTLSEKTNRDIPSVSMLLLLQIGYFGDGISKTQSENRGSVFICCWSRLDYPVLLI